MEHVARDISPLRETKKAKILKIYQVRFSSPSFVFNTGINPKHVCGLCRRFRERGQSTAAIRVTAVRAGGRVAVRGRERARGRLRAEDRRAPAGQSALTDGSALADGSETGDSYLPENGAALSDRSALAVHGGGRERAPVDPGCGGPDENF